VDMYTLIGLNKVCMYVNINGFHCFGPLEGHPSP